MHSHDLDLIAALADGSLEDETRALSRVESCADCRAEYEAQTSVLAALGSLGSTAMTEHEKAALHRDVWTDLRTGAPAAKSTAPWWYRWSYAAAGLFVIVGLAAIVSQITDGGGTTEQFEETDAAPLSATEAPAAEDTEGGDDGASTYLQSAPEAADSAGSDAAAESVDFAALAQALTETGQATRTLTTVDQSVHADCLIEAGLEDYSVIETYSLEAGDYVAAVANDAPADSETVTFVDLATCEVVYTDR